MYTLASESVPGPLRPLSRIFWKNWGTSYSLASSNRKTTSRSRISLRKWRGHSRWPWSEQRLGRPRILKRRLWISSKKRLKHLKLKSNKSRSGNPWQRCYMRHSNAISNSKMRQKKMCLRQLPSSTNLRLSQLPLTLTNHFPIPNLSYCNSREFSIALRAILPISRSWTSTLDILNKWRVYLKLTDLKIRYH